MKKGKGLIFLLLILAMCTAAPVAAGDKFYTNGPAISAAIEGTNELSPGTDTTIVVYVENRGLIDLKLVEATDITPDYLPTTAKGLTATLESGNSPVTVKSDPQIVGDIPEGYYKPAQFSINIPQDAKEGDYELIIKVDYEYMYNTQQTGTDAISYTFKKVSEDIPVLIKIKPSVQLEISEVDTSGLYAGGEGYISMNITNTGSDSGKETAIYISPVGKNPVTPIENSIYVGEFKPGDEIKARFKVSVSSDADPSQTYPIEVYAGYKNYESMSSQTATTSIGVGFTGKISFESTGEPSVAYAGGDTLIYVTYKNTGDATAYQAEGRISVVDPFSSDDDNVYLGDLAPGESARGVYKVKISSDATIKQYALDSEIRYNDAENNNYVSDTVKVLVDVQNDSETTLIIGGIIIAVVIIAAAGFVIARRKKNSD